MKKYLITMCLFIFLSLACGCSFNSPLNTLQYQTGEDQSSQRTKMIIMLRGKGGNNTIFESNGFIEEMEKRNLSFSLAAPNAHFGYYFSRTLVDRLKTDIIDPAKQQGYKEFWLVGASMGGLGALMYTKHHREDIKGVYLISPFLGYEEIIDEINNAGGIKAWEPGEYDPDDDWQRMIWHWLQQNSRNNTLPDFYLGYGTEDSFVQAHRLLESILPAENSHAIPGGHTVEVMKALWLVFLDENVLQ